MPPVIGNEKLILAALYGANAAKSIKQFLNYIPILSKIPKMENTTTLTIAAHAFWTERLKSTGHGKQLSLKEQGLILISFLIFHVLILLFLVILRKIIYVVLTLRHNRFSRRGRPMMRTIPIAGSI